MREPGSELASLHVILRGRVQGVFFRDFTRHHAVVLGLTGYVRNLPGGRMIEVQAEGQRGRLEELLRYLYHGPAGAKVEEVEARWGDYKGSFPSFEVRH